MEFLVLITTMLLTLVTVRCAPINDVVLTIAGHSVENSQADLLDDHIDRVEDMLENRYGVELDSLFDVDDDHHIVRTGYIVKPTAYTTWHALQGPMLIHKYFSKPVVTYSSTSHHIIKPVITLPKKAIDILIGSAGTPIGDTHVTSPSISAVAPGSDPATAESEIIPTSANGNGGLSGSGNGGGSGSGNGGGSGGANGGGPGSGNGGGSGDGDAGLSGSRNDGGPGSGNGGGPSSSNGGGSGSSNGGGSGGGDAGLSGSGNGGSSGSGNGGSSGSGNGGSSGSGNGGSSGSGNGGSSGSGNGGSSGGDSGGSSGSVNGGLSGSSNGESSTTALEKETVDGVKGVEDVAENPRLDVDVKAGKEVTKEVAEVESMNGAKDVGIGQIDARPIRKA